MKINYLKFINLNLVYSEYKIAHYLDKAAESLFGFVSVLPGAFSTFRWEAVKGSPLDEFLRGSNNDIEVDYKIMESKNKIKLWKDKNKSEKDKIMPWDKKNMYLAEDRIMWLEIVAKVDDSNPDLNYYLTYIPGCKCLTDPPETLKNLKPLIMLLNFILINNK